MSANQSIKPITLEEKEHLYIGGCDTVELAKKYGVSSRYIRKCFQQETGMSCQKYICTLRIGKAKERLWFTSKSATEIAHETGFGSSQYFCRVFQQYTEMTPLEYRNLWRGQKAEELCIIDF